MASSSASSPLPLAVSLGEPAGIGPDILLTLWNRAIEGQLQLPEFIVFGDPNFLLERAALLGLPLDIHEADLKNPNDQAPDHKMRVCALQNPMVAEPGRADPTNGVAVVEAITSSVEAVRAGMARGIVTLPINKKSLYDCGFEFPGHTEFLASLADEKWGGENSHHPVMMLAGPQLRSVPLTIHIPISEVPAALNAELVEETISITHSEMMDKFKIPNPRIAVSGLNPHAGEQGAMGREEIEVIEPVIAQLQKKGVNCFGPLPADTMFHEQARNQYDVAICMYHDQALIAAKALAFDETVNVTLGLPFVRTSPDHGTAFEIAGSGTAKCESVLAAIKLADHLTSEGASQ